jgi:hypothetical protein
MAGSTAYDPKLQSTYWTRWVMGLISGMILSQLVYDLILHTANEPSKVGFRPRWGSRSSRCSAATPSMSCTESSLA